MFPDSAERAAYNIMEPAGSFLRQHSPWAPVALGVGGSLLASYLAGAALMSGIGKLKNARIKDVRAASDPSVRKVPVVPAAELDNAAYLPPAPRDENGMVAALMGASPGAGDLKAAEKHGLVVAGGDFNKPGILAHELGHATIEKADNFDTAMQRVSPWSRGLGGMALGTLGGLGGAWLAGTFDKGPPRPLAAMTAAALGSLAGLGVSMVPTMWSETKATEHAGNALDKMKIPAAERDLNKQYLKRAWLTYLVGGVLAPAAIAGLGYGLINASKPGNYIDPVSGVAGKA